MLKDPALDWEQIHYTADEGKQRLMEALRDDYFEFGEPAVKYRLLTSTKDGSHTLCIKLHHASDDGILLRIFDEQFAALVQGHHPPEPRRSSGLSSIGISALTANKRFPTGRNILVGMSPSGRFPAAKLNMETSLLPK